MLFSLKDVFSGSKYCRTLLETVGRSVPNRNFRKFSLFNVEFKRRICHRTNNQQDASSIQNFYFVAKLYVFRPSTVPIIRSYQL
jgi:hypothetical protein